MIRQLRRLREVRLTRTGLSAIAVVSALATVVVIATALGKTSAQSQAIALLHRQRVERFVLPAQPAAPAPVPAATPPPKSVAVASTSKTAAPKTATTTTTTTTAMTPPASHTSSTIKHVFLIALSTPSYRAAFGSGSAMPYLDHALRPKGDLLSGYETLGATNLPDYLAMISGQAPNADTESDCTTYADFPTGAGPDKAGQVPGNGCVYPDTVLTIGDQLDAARMEWKGYFEDMGTGQPAGQQNCQHPNSGAADTTLTPGTATTTTPTTTTTTPTTTTPAVPENSYATSQNPFVYFGSLLDLGDCASDDLPLTALTTGLGSAKDTANLVYIAPALCDDGSDAPCPGVTPSGMAGADAFLKQWVPTILSSPAYKQNGVLIIVFSSSQTQLLAGQAFDHPVRTGALVISRDAKAGSTDAKPYTPYSVLRSIEDLFALKALGHATTAKSFARLALPRAWAKASG
jgi:hypothetical protein